jgi:hypothetical protein
MNVPGRRVDLVPGELHRKNVAERILQLLFFLRVAFGERRQLRKLYRGQLLFRGENVVVFVGNDVVRAVGAQNVLLRVDADAAAREFLCQGIVARQNGVLGKMADAVKRRPEKPFRVPGKVVLTQESQLVADVHFMPRNFLHPHTGAQPGREVVDGGQPADAFRVELPVLQLGILLRKLPQKRFFGLIHENVSLPLKNRIPSFIIMCGSGL